GRILCSIIVLVCAISSSPFFSSPSPLFFPFLSPSSLLPFLFSLSSFPLPPSSPLLFFLSFSPFSLPFLFPLFLFLSSLLLPPSSFPPS
ncbi:hypothetical protein ACXWRS_10390, partial [Streptococcus pyogenes]